MANTLYEHINYEKAYRKNRMNAAKWVLQHPETIEELLSYCFHADQKLATKATWVLEFVFREDLKCIYPHLDFILENLPNVKGDGQLRSFALLCEMLTLAYYKKKTAEVCALLTTKYKTTITECCFDWMITNQKVACQARAMLALYYLGTEIDWIHSELKTIILQNLAAGSAGYKNRGQKVVAMIAAREGN